MKEIILVKYGEIILKGGNRPKFEKILLQNIADAIRNIATVKITIQQATIYIEVEEEERIDLVCERLSLIFGIVTVTRAAVCEKTVEDIEKKAIEYLKDDLLPGKKFKVEAKRSDKNF